MARVKLYRVFSVVDDTTIRVVGTEGEAESICNQNEEFDYETIYDYW